MSDKKEEEEEYWSLLRQMAHFANQITPFWSRSLSNTHPISGHQSSLRPLGKDRPANGHSEDY